MKSVDQRKPNTVALKVNGKPLVMEIDTVISGATHKLYCSHEKAVNAYYCQALHIHRGAIDSKGEHDGSSLLWS